MSGDFWEQGKWAVEAITPDKLCKCCYAILTHYEYMTTYLQRERACLLHIKKIAQQVTHEEAEETLWRDVLLNDEAGYTHIVSKICIALSSFEPSQRHHLIDSNQPFGLILSDWEIQPTFVQRCFYHCDNLAIKYEFHPYPRAACVHASPPKFFGRRQKILDQHGRLLADVCEWVP